jgi:hypothetical protein
LQAGLAAGGQQRLASAQVGLRFQGAPRFEVLTHPPHGRHTETGELRNFSGAFAPFVKAEDSFADWKRDRSHGHTLPCRPAFVKLYYLWKCFSLEHVLRRLAEQLYFKRFHIDTGYVSINRRGEIRHLRLSQKHANETDFAE